MLWCKQLIELSNFECGEDLLWLTLACVRVWTAASTRAKLPLPRVVPVNRYLPIHLTCLDELVLDEVEAVLADEGGLGGKFVASAAAALFPWCLVILSPCSAAWFM